MTDALKKAAVEASEALGMSVEVEESRAITGLWDVRTFTAPDDPDGEGPVLSSECLTERAALAYLEGLEVGARIQGERHAALRATAAKLMTALRGTSRLAGFNAEACAVRQALSQLED